MKRLVVVFSMMTIAIGLTSVIGAEPTPATMKAIVVQQPGGPEVLKLQVSL